MINFEDLPEDSYITFGKPIYSENGELKDIRKSHSFLKDFINDFMERAENIKRVSKEIGIPRSLPYKILKWKDKIRLEYLLKICDFLKQKDVKKYSTAYLREHLYSISSCRGGEIKPYLSTDGILKRTFPFTFKTTEAIKCLTFPYGDGFINMDYSGHIRLGYTNSDKGLHKEILKCVNETFGQVDYSQREAKDAYETFFTAILGKIYVECLGFEYGNKTKNTEGLQFLPYLTNQELIGACISQFLDDEGCFSSNTIYITLSAGENFMSEKKPKKIDNLEKYAPIELKQISNLLSEIGVENKFRAPHKYHDESLEKWKLAYHLTINGIQNILRLWSYVSLKREDLKEKIERKVNEWKKTINKIKEVEREKGHFTIDDISNILDTSMESARNYFNSLKKAGFTKIYEEGKYKTIEGKQVYHQTKYKLKIPNNLKDIFSAD